MRKLGVSPEVVLPIVPSPQEWGYRSRVQFKCVDTSQGFQVGFYRRGSHNVIPVASCPIIHPALNQAKDLLRVWISNTRWAKQVPQIDLAVDDQDRVRAVIHSLASNVDDFIAHLKLRAADSGIALFVQLDRKAAPLHVCGPLELIVEVDIPVLRLGYGPGGFAQINLPQNRAMVRESHRLPYFQSSEQGVGSFLWNGQLQLARGSPGSGINWSGGLSAEYRNGAP